MNQKTMRDEIRALLGRMREAQVTVFGDFCVDAYWEMYDGEQELSVETGLPVRRVKGQRYSLGGAGGVLANLVEMGVGAVRAVGLSGTDVFGETMRSLLLARGAEMSGFLTAPAWQTMVYAKPFLGDREDSRIDFGAFNVMAPELEEALLRELEAAARASQVVVLNQQIEGGVTSPAMIERINAIVARNPGTIFLVDSRHHPEKYRGVALKINMREAARVLGEEEGIGDEAARRLGSHLSNATQRPAFITRGEHGMAAAADGEVSLILGLQVIGQTDPVGAGDTVAAAVAGALAAGAEPVLAAEFANIAAMVTVKKLQTAGTASAEEILAAAHEPNYVYEPELASAPHRAHYLPGTEIEVIGEVPANLSIRHCVFDHDGTLSALREGWEQIMEPVMLKALMGKHYLKSPDTVLDKMRQTVKQLISRTTGQPTIMQMQALADLVPQMGFVPVDEVQDAHGYKRMFNDALMDMVNGRIRKLREGELHVQDFEIKGATRLLEELYKRGVRLYLASGTDVNDVKIEAEAMGYAHFFEGRIFGAVADPTVDAKKMVLDQIISEFGLEGHQFCAFGDGPAEIRETRRRGGFSVGVASDEVRRFGLNLYKRDRLIRSGANMIVADYSQLPALLKALKID